MTRGGALTERQKALITLMHLPDEPAMPARQHRWKHAGEPLPQRRARWWWLPRVFVNTRRVEQFAR